MICQEVAKNDLASFILAVNPAYSLQWFHEAICDRIDIALESGNQNLMFFLPPRHGKSEIISRYLPAYCLGRWPDDSIIATSYGDDLSSQNNRDVQRIIDSESYRNIFPNTTLSSKNIRTQATGTWLRNSDIFEVVGRKGIYRSAGVGGGITGMGFSRLGVIDDPVKNREEAESKTYQNKIYDWYKSTFLTRRQKGAVVIIILTRWHRNDLAGRLLEEEPESWDVIQYPAILENAYAYRHYTDKREVGEALWPSQYSVEFLEQFRRNRYEWDALFQQTPYIRGGNLINRDWFRQVDILPSEGQRIRFWDLAGTEKNKTNDPDWTVGALCQYYGGTYYIIDVVAERGSPAAVESLIAQTAQQDEYRYPGTTQIWEEEGGASGKMVSAYLSRVLDRYRRQAYRVNKSKESYVDRLANKAETGNIAVHNGTGWLYQRCDGQTFYDESEAFPKGAHDDRIDAVAKAVYLLSERVGIEQYLSPIMIQSAAYTSYQAEQSLF